MSFNIGDVVVIQITLQQGESGKEFSHFSLSVLPDRPARCEPTSRQICVWVRLGWPIAGFEYNAHGWLAHQLGHDKLEQLVSILQVNFWRNFPRLGEHIQRQAAQIALDALGPPLR